MSESDQARAAVMERGRARGRFSIRDIMLWTGLVAVVLGLPLQCSDWYRFDPGQRAYYRQWAERHRQFERDCLHAERLARRSARPAEAALWRDRAAKHAAFRERLLQFQYKRK